jgi:hypothetical protein
MSVVEVVVWEGDGRYAAVPVRRIAGDRGPPRDLRPASPSKNGAAVSQYHLASAATAGLFFFLSLSLLRTGRKQ